MKFFIMDNLVEESSQNQDLSSPSLLYTFSNLFSISLKWLKKVFFYLFMIPFSIIALIYLTIISGISIIITFILNRNNQLDSTAKKEK